MVIGVRGMAASAATAVVVGLGAFAAPTAFAAPEMRCAIDIIMVSIGR